MTYNAQQNLIQTHFTFLLTKRLLGLAYLWNCHRNGVQIQVLATLIFYTVLNHLGGSYCFKST
jgi:hypothetical protein